VQRITSIGRLVTVRDVGWSTVVTGGIHCVTGEVPVGIWSVSNRFIEILTGLTELDFSHSRAKGVGYARHRNPP
jgi:hypothetical protein